MMTPTPTNPYVRYKWMRHNRPSDFLAALKAAVLPPWELTYAAEAASGTDDADVIDALLALTRHASPVVREGALYGVWHSHEPRVTARIREMADHDESPAVRGLAANCVEEMAP